MPIVGTEGNDVLVGGSGDDVLIAGGGNDSLDGRGGADEMHGGAGDDLFFVNQPGDSTIEEENGGIDTVIASFSSILQAHIERLTLAGTALSGTGNALANLIIGNAGNNHLDGGAGADLMKGREGNDTYVVDDAGDVIEEGSGQGIDSVLASVSHTLAYAVENLTLTGIGNIDAIGNAYANLLIGNAGNNILNGMGGADVMKGRAGNDIYYVDNAGDVTDEAYNQGIDSVFASISHVLNGEVENLTLTGSAPLDGTGNSYANRITGNISSNRLDGRGGADIMAGGAGNDTYVVDHVGDQTVENAGEGSDTVLSSISHVLAANIERLTLTGAAAINGTGNALANTMSGNAAANRLDGGAGADALSGGAGDDIYVVDNGGDQVIENGGEGTDTVLSSVTHSLRANVERLTLTGAAATAGTGNALANTILGNVAANRLDGGAGADEMRGGAGDDTYYVDNAGDLIFEATGEGLDSIFASASHILSANVERLTLTGSAALSGTGNDLANIIVGNAAANVLDGRGGADDMHGGAGDDIYHVDNAADRTIELAGQGIDTVLSSVSHTLRIDVERLTLTGGAAIDGTGNGQANTIQGNAAANTLDGGVGADMLSGAAGDDIYLVDNAGDQVIENAGGGSDTVRTSVSYALAAASEVETLSAANPAATGALDLTGNASANALDGNAGQNWLDGKGGNDMLTGLGGADTFGFSTALGAGNVDVIADFDPAADRIALSGDIFAGLATGPLAADWFVAGPAATTAFHRIVYNPATGALLFDADGAGGAAAVQFASLLNAPPLTAGDFVVTGAPNGLPTIISGSTATVAENASASTIVYDAAATDPDGDAFSFFLSGADAALFTINPATGEVRLRQPADYEQDNSFSITVGVSDSTGGVNPSGGTRTVLVSVTDVADNPSTPIVQETTLTNDSRGTAQEIARSTLAVADNPNLENDSLPSITIRGSIAAATDRDFFSITLGEGELLILDVDGTGGGLDAMLRVYGPGGAQLTENDDGRLDTGSAPHPNFEGVSLDSLLRFRAPQAGTYYFSIESFEQGSTGSWNLHVSVGPPGGADEIHEENIEALISGSQWSSPAVTFGFPTSPADYPPGSHEGEPQDNFGAFSAVQQNAVRQILTQISQVTSLSFTENSSSPGTAQLRYAMSDAPEAAYAYYPGSDGAAGSSWYNKSSGFYTNPSPGNYAWMTFIHESGHALGLKHGHEAPALSWDRDSLEFSVMTYRSYVGASIDADEGFTNETFGYPQSLMMYDIAALQRMYGPDFTFNGGDSVYSWSPTTGQMSINGVGQLVPGANRVFLTVWDGGGTDSYDMSSYNSPTVIDLRPGEWSKTSSVQLANLGDSNIARGNVANALQFEDDPRSLIENAVGGSANDHIVANEAVNRLTGNGDSDIFQWMSAADSRPGSADTITDFDNVLDDTPADKIRLDLIDANLNTPADDPFAFVGTSAFSSTAGELRYEVTGNGVRLEGDTDGNGVADFAIFLSNLTSIEPAFLVL